MASKPSIDPAIRARFKETARRIIANDRLARRTGNSQNTIGEIERAMVQAYRIGANELVLPIECPQSPLALPWEALPPRAREIFSLLTSSLSRLRGGDGTPTGRLAVALAEGGRWHIRNKNGSLSSYSFGESGVNALVRLGLLAFDSDAPNERTVTDVGIETARAYWVRDDRGDPTLPWHSIRG